ncbi:MAG: hypothetical protein ACR2OZ_19115 [Verrucomicrobiales bacterium]
MAKKPDLPLLVRLFSPWVMIPLAVLVGLWIRAWGARVLKQEAKRPIEIYQRAAWGTLLHKGWWVLPALMVGGSLFVALTPVRTARR